MTDAQLKEHYKLQKQLKIMLERVCQTNKEEVIRKSRSPPKTRPTTTPLKPKVKSKTIPSTETQVGSSLHRSSTVGTGTNGNDNGKAAEIMQQMTKGECSDVINQLTTHDKIKMMHGIMETKRLQ